MANATAPPAPGIRRNTFRISNSVRISARRWPTSWPSRCTAVETGPPKIRATSRALRAHSSPASPSPSAPAGPSRAPPRDQMNRRAPRPSRRESGDATGGIIEPGSGEPAGTYSSASTKSAPSPSSCSTSAPLSTYWGSSKGSTLPNASTYLVRSCRARSSPNEICLVTSDVSTCTAARNAFADDT